jgi:hypothetical protein
MIGRIVRGDTSPSGRVQRIEASGQKRKNRGCGYFVEQEVRKRKRIVEKDLFNLGRYVWKTIHVRGQDKEGAAQS